MICRNFVFLSQNGCFLHYIIEFEFLMVFEVLMAESDQYYIGQCLNGHPDEFRYLVRRYQAALLAYLAGRSGNITSAEEAAQETFVRAYFGLSGLKKHESFHSWLLGIANRVAKEQFRERRQLCESDRPVEEIAELQAADEYELEGAIADLPDSYREIVLLRFYAGLSCSQIAERFNVPVGTVTKQLSRAYMKLRLSLSDKKEA